MDDADREAVPRGDDTTADAADRAVEAGRRADNDESGTAAATELAAGLDVESSDASVVIADDGAQTEAERTARGIEAAGAEVAVQLAASPAETSGFRGTVGISRRIVRPPGAPPPIEAALPPRRRASAVSSAAAGDDDGGSPGRGSPSLLRERPPEVPPLLDEDIAAGVATYNEILKKREAELAKNEKKRRAAELRAAAAEAARRKAEQAAEKLRKEEEEFRIRVHARLVELARLGRSKLKILPPPQPPLEPIKRVEFDKAVTRIIPRGKMVIKISRVSGIIGLAEGSTDARTATAAKSSRSMFTSMFTGKSAGEMRTVTNEDGEQIQITSGEVYIRFELDLGAGKVGARTHSYKNVVLQDFETLGADVEFRISAGFPLPDVPDGLSAADRVLYPPVLFYSVWRVGRLSDYLLGEGQLPAGALFTPHPERGFYPLSFPLMAEGQGALAPHSRYREGTLKAWMSGSFSFIPTQSGILTLTVHEGRELSALFGQIKPYARMTVGKELASVIPGPEIGGAAPAPVLSVRGSTCVEGGSNPMFNHEELIVWIDHEHGVADAVIEVALCTDTTNGVSVVGSIKVPVRDWSSSFSSVDEVLDLTTTGFGGESSAGAVALTRRFYPAGQLTVKIVRGLKIMAMDALGTSDAYAKIHLEGVVRNYAVKTKTVFESGPRPVWNETFVFDVVDHADMRIQVLDYDQFTSDDMIGEVMIDLGPIFKYGVRDAVVPLKRPNLWGGLNEAGLLYVEADFVAPQQELAYPMLQPDRPTFDGSMRTSRAEAGGTARNKKDDADSDDGQPDEEAEENFLKRQWSEEDIEEAFKALDLNHDLFVGRQELRHSLVGLGEQFTELEIDEMIDMVDFDGDGRVAFYEFYQMCKALDPSQPMWKPNSEESYKERDWFSEGGIRGLDDAVTSGQGGGGGQKVLDQKALVELDRQTKARAAELQKKQDKKKACDDGVGKLGIRLVELQKAFQRFTKMEADSKRHRVPGQVTQEELGKCFDMDPDVLRHIYSAFLNNLTDDSINFRDVLLGLVNFVGCTRPQRINFCFYLFDMDGSGTIDVSEIQLILKGAHLAGSTSYVRKKAETILKAVGAQTKDGEKAAAIDLEKFVIAASRFPNVLFPSYEDREPDGKLKKVELQSLEAQAFEKEMNFIKERIEKFQRDKHRYGEGTIPIPIPGHNI